MRVERGRAHCSRCRSRRCSRKGNFHQIQSTSPQGQTAAFQKVGAHRRNRYVGDNKKRTNKCKCQSGSPLFVEVPLGRQVSYLSEVDFIKDNLVRIVNAVESRRESQKGKDDYGQPIVPFRLFDRRNGDQRAIIGRQCSVSLLLSGSFPQRWRRGRHVEIKWNKRERPRNYL